MECTLGLVGDDTVGLVDSTLGLVDSTLGLVELTEAIQVKLCA